MLALTWVDLPYWKKRILIKITSLFDIYMTVHPTIGMMLYQVEGWMRKGSISSFIQKHLFHFCFHPSKLDLVWFLHSVNKAIPSVD